MMIRKMSPTSQEQYVFMGEDTRVQVAFFFFFFGVVRLHLRRKFSFFFNCKMWRSYPLLGEI